MGLGKTAATLLTGAHHNLRRWLVICPNNALSVWRDEAYKWLPTVTNVPIKIEFVDDEPWYREYIWDTPYDPHCIHIRVCTYGVFLKDWGEVKKLNNRLKTVQLKPRRNYNVPQILVLDEAKRIRNKEVQAFKIIDRYDSYYSPEYVYPMTGTPGHEPKHFWTMLHLIDRRYFKSFWNFVYTFHVVDDTGFGLEINEPRNLDQFHDLLRRYFSVVDTGDIGLTRQLLEIRMENDQARVYEDLELEMIAFLDRETVVVPNEFALLTRLRQLLVCPKLISSSLGYGAAIKDFCETMEPGEATVIFCPFTKAFPHFAAYLLSKGFKTNMLHGGLTRQQVDYQLAEFKSSRSVMLCSVLYAQAFSLEPAEKCFFIGYDWDPENNRQAEYRLKRITTEYTVNAYYYTYRSTFDERLANAVNIKQRRINAVIPQDLRTVFIGSD